MLCRRWTLFPAFWAVLGTMVLSGAPALGRDTEQQLSQRIEKELNPVKRAKDEVKLAGLKLRQAEQAYDKGDTQLGSELVETCVTHLQASWKDLQGSGRMAAKQPQGFKELDIALREQGRVLKDLGRRVSYFNRSPIDKAAKEMDQIRSEVLEALFPAAKPHTTNPPATRQQFTGPGSSSEMW
jgi:hypothetical protein